MENENELNIYDRECVTPRDLYNVTNRQSVNDTLGGIKDSVIGSRFASCGGFGNLCEKMNDGFGKIDDDIKHLGFKLAEQHYEIKMQMLQDKYDNTRYQLEQANTAVANAVQTQNILNALGRYYPYWGFRNATTEVTV